MIADASRNTDPLDPRFRAEAGLIGKRVPFGGTFSEDAVNAQELAADYASAGLWQDALDVFQKSAVLGFVYGNEWSASSAGSSPIVRYLIADLQEKKGLAEESARNRTIAARQPPDYAFPFQAELIPVLRRAMAANPADARAPYYLGNLLFDWQPAEAIALWEKSVSLDPSFAMPWRNLAQAYAHQKTPDALPRAIAALEKAVASPAPHPTQLAELDTLYASAKTAPAKRLALLEAHEAALRNHDEALARLIGLKTFAGKSDEAIALLSGHTFNIWEGGTRFNTAESWIDAHLARGVALLNAKKPREALAAFTAATAFPANLRANDTGARKAEISYWLGVAHDALGNAANARDAWTAATTATFPAGRRQSSDVEITGENSRRSAQRYFQALAWRHLGDSGKADATFRELVKAGDATPATGGSAAHFAAGLGYVGLGEKEKARAAFTAALADAPDHLATRQALDQL